jgi:predicted anti-sigma-YlaC factor YlaD
MKSQSPCEQVQNDLLEGRAERHARHLEVCAACREFARSLAFLEGIRTRTVPCPEHLTFERIRDNAAAGSRRDRRVSIFRHSALAAAALLLFALWYRAPEIERISTGGAVAVAQLNRSITAEIESLDESLDAMESDFFVEDETVDREMEALWEEIDNLERREV